MRYFSMFTGIGGFELGIERAYEDNKSRQSLQGTERGGVRSKRDKPNVKVGSNRQSKTRGDRQFQQPENIGYSEIDKYAIQIFEKHFPNIKNYGDATRIIPEQLPNFELLVAGFPCQSFSIAGQRKGFEDTRGTLFFDIARIAEVKKPRLVFLENVKGLLSHDFGETFLKIISTLDELGYDCQWQVLNSKNFGVPQNRERVFIIGHLRGTGRPEVFPIGEVEKEVAEIRTEIRNKDSGELKGEKWGYTERRALRVRRLTPTECERLQGFPNGWTEGLSDTQRYKTLGNAVTVNVIKEIMKKLL